MTVKTNEHVIYRALGEQEGEPVFWVSITGEQWLPVQGEGVSDLFTDPPTLPDEDDYKALVDFFEIKHGITKDGHAKTMSRMTYATRYVVGKWGAGASMLNPLPVTK